MIDIQEQAVFDATGDAWETMVDGMLAKSSRIIALRGAGSFNGISVEDVNRILNTHLIPRIGNYLSVGPVSVIFDGDNDDPSFPDIGHIMGRLRDTFGDRVDWYAVQVAGWYRYRAELPRLRPLHSANGGEYRTVVFPDKTFPGEHDHFSQHARLARSPQYQQWYVGACGKIASAQLADYSAKAEGASGPHTACVFGAEVSIEQERKIRAKLANESDPVKAKRLADSLAQRMENPFGLLCDKFGYFLPKEEYRNLRIKLY